MVQKTSGATWCEITAQHARKEVKRPGRSWFSSRACYEMVEKTAICGVEILFTIFAATSLAVEVAERGNLILLGFSKLGRVIVFIHPSRIV